MSPWIRFEATHVLGIVLFICAGIGGLLCAWVGLAFNPYAVPVIQPQDAVWLFTWETVLLCASFALAFSARTLVVREWMGIANSANSKSHLMAAWCAFIIPLFIAALLSISSWMAIVILGMIGIAGRGFVMAHAAFSEYTAARGKLTVKSGPYPWLWIAACSVAALIGFFAMYNLGPVVEKARIEMLRPVQAQMGLLDGRLGYAREDLPVLEQAQAERIGVENEILKREMHQAKKGVGSESDVQTARARLLAAQIDALKTVAEARNAVSRLASEKIDLETKLIAIKSAAPAMKGH
jgi:hypothetical protein